MSPWRGAGLAVPVFSLRSTEGIGVGEFLDIKLLVDFSIKCGLHMIQLLPVNDTSVNGMWWDSYPYRYAIEHNLLLFRISSSMFHLIISFMFIFCISPRAYFYFRTFVVVPIQFFSI